MNKFGIMRLNTAGMGEITYVRQICMLKYRKTQSSLRLGTHKPL